MNIVGSQKIRALGAAFVSLFNKAMADTKTTWQEVAMVVKSTTSSNDYGWMKDLPNLRKWVGERIVKQIEVGSYSIHNEKYELTLGVSKDDLDDDNLGMYSNIATGIGESIKRHPDQLVWDLLKNGHQEKCLDGQYFFDTDHPVAGKTVSNKLGGSGELWTILDTSKSIKPIIFQEREQGKLQQPHYNRKTDNVEWDVKVRCNVGFGLWQGAVSSNQDLTEDNFKTARQTMYGFKNDEGEPLGMTPTVIAVHPTLYDTAVALFETPTLASGGGNPLYKAVKVIRVDRW